MFNRVKTAAQLTAVAAQCAKEGVKHRKMWNARQKQAEQYNMMIAESQSKIGPYIPTPCPVQIWA